MPRYLVIDGYNAISKISLLKTKKDFSLESARETFIKLLKDFMNKKNLFDKILIVFDSKRNELAIKRHTYGDIEVLFSVGDKDADKVIVDILRKSAGSSNISVSSDDNFVRNHARVFGCDVIGIKELEGIILNKKGFINSIDEKKEKDLGEGEIKDINEELKEYWGVV